MHPAALRRLAPLAVLPFASLVGANAPTAGGDPSLVVFTVEDGPRGPGCDGRHLHLLRFDFADGEPAGCDTILSVPAQPHVLECRAGGIVGDRHLVTDAGWILDLVEGRLLHEPGDDGGRTRLRAIDGNTVWLVHRSYDGQDRHRSWSSYDLRLRVHAPREEPGRWGLPGVLSPDGRRGAQPRSRGPGRPSDLFVHGLDGGSRRIASGLAARMAPFSSAFPAVPVLWLDDARILTQRDTGDLVVVGLDGSLEPLVRLELPDVSGDPRRALEEGRYGGALSRREDGAIVYTMTRAVAPGNGPPRESYLIDPEGRTCTSYVAEWEDLGHGFSAEVARTGFRTLRHGDREIGRLRFHPTHARSARGRIAVPTLGGPGSGGARGVTVWSDDAGRWVPLEIPRGHWLAHGACLGWLTPPPGPAEDDDARR